MFRDLHHHPGQHGFPPALTVVSPRGTTAPVPGAGEERGDVPRGIAVRQIYEQDTSGVARPGEQKMIRKILAAFGITAAIALFSTSVAGSVSSAAAAQTSGTGSVITAGPPWG
jgi:hypothetical protein